MSTAEIEHPVTTTTSGPVMGKEKAGVFQFCGIPYAAAPVGDLRFKRAQPAPGWSDVRDATRFGPAAPQIPSGGMTDSVPVRWDEDCLTLNVCTPAIDDERRPVLVWIHGGGYRTGQGAIPWYNGTSFAVNGDIVVVSINYRLGALGFADLSRFGDDYATSGVNGILDQIHALEWVQANISNFGGDPGRVTIAGESAGGFSVSTLLGSPRAKGLFHRAIPQSGAAHHTLTIEAAARATDLLLEELGAETMHDLLAKSPMEIMEAQNRVDPTFTREGIGQGVSAFYPVDHNEVLPETLLGHLREGVGKDIPVLTGTNKDEATLFIMKAVSEASLQKQAEGYGGGEALIEAYRHIYPESDATDLAIKLNTDFAFKIPALRLAEIRDSLGADTWVYQFDWESRAPHLKATHALEIPFSFNMLQSAGVAAFIGEGELPQQVADDMHTAWTHFIRGESPGWQPYTANTRQVMHFDNESSLVENGDEAVTKAWEGIR